MLIVANRTISATAIEAQEIILTDVYRRLTLAKELVPEMLNADRLDINLAQGFLRLDFKTTIEFAESWPRT